MAVEGHVYLWREIYSWGGPFIALNYGGLCIALDRRAMNNCGGPCITMAGHV